MPAKSIREMSEREKRVHSLSSRMFNATLLTCIIVGVVAFIIGLGFYSYALSRQLVSKAFSLAQPVQTYGG